MRLRLTVGEGENRFRERLGGILFGVKPRAEDSQTFERDWARDYEHAEVRTR